MTSQTLRKRVKELLDKFFIAAFGLVWIKAIIAGLILLCSLLFLQPQTGDLSRGVCL